MVNDSNIRGLRVAVTGGTSGLGLALVRLLSAEEAAVSFVARTDVDVERVANETGAIGIVGDVSQKDAIYPIALQITANLGGLDILINNAGITKDTLMLRMSEEQWDKVIEVNLKSVFNLTKHAMRPMLKQRSGSIINMSSVVGVFGNAGQANYAASKAGIIGFSKSIAKEVGSRGIRCNAVAPGFIETDMTHALTEEQQKAYVDSIPLKRLGSGKDIADACIFLGSDMSTYVTGQVISVCGGLNT